MSNWSRDYATSEERVPRRRASDQVRWLHIVVYVTIAVLAATGMIGGALDKMDERNAALLAEQAVSVVHQLQRSCGL